VDNLIAQFLNKINQFDNIGMKVGKNERLLHIHTMRDNYAEKTYKRAKELVEQYYTIDDDDEFRKHFAGYLRKQIAKEKYITSIEENINWVDLNNLSMRYLEYHVNWDAYSYDLELTNPKQIDTWKLCEKLCKTLNASQDISIEFGSIPFLEYKGKWQPSFDKINLLK
jgi:hypothetical protein